MTDPETLQALTDTVSSLQRQLNDIATVLQGQDTRLVTTESDITVLQNPPIGVPPGLLSWFSLSHGIKEVDTVLASDLSVLSGDVTTNTTDIATLQSNLTQEISDRLTADEAITNTTDDLQAQVTANLGTLTQEITDRGTLSGVVSDGFDTVNSRIDTLESDMASGALASDTVSNSHAAQIASLNASLQTAQTQISLLQGTGVDPLGAQASQITSLTVIANDAATAVALETTNRTNADNVLQSSITTLNSSLSGLNTGLSDETGARKAADIDIQSDITALQAGVSGQSALITAETAARVAADTTLTTNVDDNTVDITDLQTGLVTEATDRTTADTTLQTSIDTNTANIAANTAGIATNSASIGVINPQFSVIKDGGNYVTGWRVIDQTSPAGSFNLRNLNNDLRLQNPGYVGKYFAATAVSSFASPVTFSTQYGVAPSSFFHGTDGNDYTRAVLVYSTPSVSINGSVFVGVDYNTGGSLNRLGQELTTFVVNFEGAVNRYLSLWYRIKTAPGDTSQRWFPVALADNTMPAQRTYERVSKRAVVQINVTANQVIEFGLTNLNTLDASISDASQSLIYGGNVSITALNMVTIS